MQQQIDNLQRQIDLLLEWKFQRERQQISFPIDQTSMSIINKDNGKTPIGGLYLSITGVNPSIELGYGTWAAVGANLVLRSATGASGGTGNVVAGAGASVIFSTYDINVWRRTS